MELRRQNSPGFIFLLQCSYKAVHNKILTVKFFLKSSLFTKNLTSDVTKEIDPRGSNLAHLNFHKALRIRPF